MAMRADDFEISVDNATFLQAIFRENWQFAHVTAFFDDPGDIDKARRGICWAGGWYRDEHLMLVDYTNQYFTISVFSPDAQLGAVRRRDNFLATYAIVADDVKDKVPEERARLLPAPSWRLETSPGNEQWGWILRDPENSRDRVDNLLDGLVKLGLAPDGMDPGMRGVTRYVRLPEGWNRKAKYGEPFKCRMLEWEPDRMVALEELAIPFGVDLTAERKSRGGDLGACAWPDEAPVVEWLGDGHLVNEKCDGEYRIVCPWVDEHTDGDESGTWVRLLDDGTGEFKCHHGHCQERGFNDFLVETGLREAHDTWAAGYRFEAMVARGQSASVVVPQQLASVGAQQAESVELQGAAPFWKTALDALPADPTHDLPALRQIMAAMIGLPSLEKGAALQALKDRCKGFIPARQIEQELRQTETAARREEVVDSGGDVFSAYYFVEEDNEFYRPADDTSMGPGAFDTSLGHLEFYELTPEGLQRRISASKAFGQQPEGQRQVVNAYGWHPAGARVIGMDHRRMVNTYLAPDAGRFPSNPSISGSLEDYLFVVRSLCGEVADLVLDHMAFTLQYPGEKIRWQVFGYGVPRSGKTTIAYPLIRILGRAGGVVKNEDLDAKRGIWGDHFHRRKAVLMEEVWQPGNPHFYNAMKTRLVNNEREHLNLKMGRVVEQQNLYAVYMFSNYPDALHFDENDNKLLVFEVTEHLPGMDEAQRQQFFTRLYRWLDYGDGLREIYQFLMDRDLSQFNYGALPVKTEAYHQACRAGKPEVVQFLAEALEHSDAPFNTPFVTTQRIKALLSGEGYTRFGDRLLASFLKENGYEKRRGQKKVEGKWVATPRFWICDETLLNFTDSEFFACWQQHGSPLT